jgi:hypothetical protein
VPAPRPSGGGDDAHLPLVVAIVSLVLPLLGPLAWWLVERTARSIEAGGGDQPSTLRQARLLAITGTVLLCLLVVCTAPIVLVIG